MEIQEIQRVVLGATCSVIQLAGMVPHEMNQVKSPFPGIWFSHGICVPCLWGHLALAYKKGVSTPKHSEVFIYLFITSTALIYFPPFCFNSSDFNEPILN